MSACHTTGKIARAARRLLDKEGTDAVTMRRVAEAVGITPMAIYRHYPDRAALLNALADEGFEELAASLGAKRFSGRIEQRLAKMTEIYLEHALQNPRLFELMFLKPGAKALAATHGISKLAAPRNRSPMVEAVREGMKSSHFREGRSVGDRLRDGRPFPRSHHALLGRTHG